MDDDQVGFTERTEVTEVDTATFDATDEVVADEVVDRSGEKVGAFNITPQVAGVMTDEERSKFDSSEVNICVECTWVGPIDKGVASCPACGGKTKRSLRWKAKAVKAEDEARFNGQSAEKPQINE